MLPDVTIDRFRLQGDTGQRHLLLQSFDSQRWPGEDSAEILVIKRIEISGPWWQLGQKAAAEAQSQLAAKVSAWSPEAEQASIVCFQNQAELIACLLVDVGEQRLARWYWQGIIQQYQPMASGIASFLAEHWLQLPGVFTTLIQRDRLTALVAALGAEILSAVHADLSRKLHAPGLAGQAQGPDYSLSVKQQRRIQTFIVELASSRVADSSSRKQAAQLLALIAVWSHAPSALATALPLLIAGDVEQALSESSPSIGDGDQRNGAGPRAGEHGKKPGDDHATIDALATKKAHLPQGNQSQSPHMATTTTANENTGLGQQASFTTEFGGFFYLLNAIRISTVYPNIEKSAYSPWLWCLWISQEMGIELDMSLLGFIAEEVGIEACREPGIGQQLHAIERDQTFDRVVENLRQWFTPRGIWVSALFDRTARISIEGPHIDVTYSMESVDVAIRQAALDIDPGWYLPLARVIKFHYAYLD